jgi:hypothetical protein
LERFVRILYGGGGFVLGLLFLVPTVLDISGSPTFDGFGNLAGSVWAGFGVSLMLVIVTAAVFIPVLLEIAHNTMRRNGKHTVKKGGLRL